MAVARPESDSLTVPFQKKQQRKWNIKGKFGKLKIGFNQQLHTYIINTCEFFNTLYFLSNFFKKNI